LLKHFAGSPHRVRATAASGIATSDAWSLLQAFMDGGSCTGRLRDREGLTRVPVDDLVISNIETCALPKISLSLSSALTCAC
jgi:hypothetical protein